METDLALPRPYTNFLKRSFKYSGTMLWNNLSYEAKAAHIVVGCQTQTCLLSPSMPSTGSHWFHVIYFLFLIPFFICKAVPLRLQNNAKEAKFFWIHIQIYNPAWKRQITSGHDYVALTPAIYTCTNLSTLFVTHIIVNIIYYYSFRIFPRFWLVKTTPIIRHNQLPFTKFGKKKIFAIMNQWRQKCSPPKIIEPMTSKWRQKGSPLQIIESMTEKTWGQGCVIFGERKNKERNGETPSRTRKIFWMNNKAIIEFGFRRIWRILQIL